ncbi:DNA mismatch endonuclease Vsr [Acidaminococcus fermentans]|uniref:very short patch repair endonuclease n=2 Tax=Acidaminococcus fermentans TaxID=905 RepID=UPI0030796C16
MTDIKTPAERSKNMAAIKSKNTRPEFFFRKLLFAQGLRYRTNYARIEGHPDIYLPKWKTAIFVHGCFWHRHKKCKFAYQPKSNVAFWNLKFEKNIKRDKAVQEVLDGQKIKCLIVWECTIKQMKRDPIFSELIIEKTKEFICGREMYLEL